MTKKSIITLSVYVEITRWEMEMVKKRILRAVSAVLTASMLVCCAGCSDGAKATKSGQKNTSAPPDYSKTEQIVDMYAYIGPTDGSYYTSTGLSKQGEDHRTKERYQEYKDCGMNILMLLGNNAFNGSSQTEVTAEAEEAAFAESRVKIDLDLCEEVGLKTIVFDNRLWRLSACEMSLIKEDDKAQPLWFVCQGNFHMANLVTYDAGANEITLPDGAKADVDFVQYQFESMEELHDYVRILMSSYHDHPAFYGITLYDEPAEEKLLAVGQVTKAVRTLYPDCYVHTVLLPYYGGGHSVMSVADEDAFLEYLDTYLEESGNSYFGYDYYPFKGTSTSSGKSEDRSLAQTWIRTLQISAWKAQEKDVDWEIAIQSFAFSNEGFRFVNEDDIRLQSNLGLAFDTKRISYFTYWMWQNKTGMEYCQAIMGDNGEKILYDEVQKVNQETQILAQAVLNYDYVATYLSWDRTYGSMPLYFMDAVSEDLTNVIEITSSGAAVINEMYDEKNKLTGYMMVNTNDTYEGIENRVSITFDGYKKAVVYTAQGPTKVSLKDGVYTRILKGGEAVLVVPY